MRTLFQKAAMAAAMSALMMGGAFAQTATTLPPVHKDGQVEYLSGGIGEDQAAAIEHAGKHWPLTLEFAVKGKHRAQFAADVNVVVRDAKGQTALQATAGGPFLLAKLAPGHYAVEATFAAKTLHEKVDIKHGHPAKAVFLWPAGTGETRS